VKKGRRLEHERGLEKGKNRTGKVAQVRSSQFTKKGLENA
jgi:hypothetical protein